MAAGKLLPLGPLGREALAAPRTRASQNLTTILGRHASAEAMPASPHQLARLVSALHSYTCPLRNEAALYRRVPGTSSPRPRFEGIYRRNSNRLRAHDHAVTLSRAGNRITAGASVENERVQEE